MSTILEKTSQILSEKNANLVSENIKAGVTIFDVTGTYSPSFIVPDGMKLGESTFSQLPNNLVFTDNITNMEGMFLHCYNLTTIPLIDTSNVEYMGSMFARCTNLTTIPLIDTHNVVHMGSMFEHCDSLVSIPQLDTSNVTNMGWMFCYCTTLEDVPVLDTSKVTVMQDMFKDTVRLTNESLDNILQMCINAISYNDTKTLYYIGISSYPYSASTIQSLPHYQDFIDAGWTIGY